MSDLVERLRTNVCPDNHGCGVMPYCACASMADAADEIARLHAEKAELVEALAKIKDETLLGVSNGLGERIYALTCGALSRARAENKEKGE